MAQDGAPPQRRLALAVTPAETLALWTSLVKSAIGALGLALVALGPLVPAPAEFPALRGYAFTAAFAGLLWAASARHRQALGILGGIALAAGLAASVVGGAQPLASQSALALYCGAGVLLGGFVRGPWLAVPLLLIPVLIVAAGPPGWEDGHDGFAQAWSQAMGCDCLWPGLPAALSLVGGAIGAAAARPWTPVRPSALLVGVVGLGVAMAALVVRTVLPTGMAAGGLPDWLSQLAVTAGALAWVAAAYQSGRPSFVWQSGAAGLLLLVGQLYADPSIRYPDSFGVTLLATVLASLLPAVLAAVGLLVRQWVGTEGPAESSAFDLAAFFRTGRPAAHVETGQPLQVGGFGARDRPDEVAMGTSRTDGGNE